MSIVDVLANTATRTIHYRDFLIEEAYSNGQYVWEWAHKNYDRVSFPAAGECQTVFECIDAVDAWHEQNDASAWPVEVAA